MTYYTLSQLEKSIGTDIHNIIPILIDDKIHVKKRYINNNNNNNNKNRKIYLLNKKSVLYIEQKKILNLLKQDIKYSDKVFGYIEGRSYTDFLQLHTGKKTYVKMDIKDFFGSIDIRRLSKMIIDKFDFNHHEDSELFLNYINTSCFDNEQLPLGFVTSPILSNIYMLRIDIRIEKFCNNNYLEYSRYADDIIISSNKKLDGRKIIRTVQRILEDYKLELNMSKTRVSYDELILGGFVISNELRLSNKKLKMLRNILFLMEHNQLNGLWLQLINTAYKSEVFTLVSLSNYLSGMRSFLIDTKKHSKSGNWNQKASKLIKRIENCLIILSKELMKVY